MTAAEPAGPVIEGVRTLEVRWILPGPLQTPVAEWFGRFPVRFETREDTYLLDPYLPGLSVKVRGGGAPFEVKVYRGSPGVLEVGERARGRIESWQKWSFPCDAPSQGSGAPPGWRPVLKTRRISRFLLASGRAAAPGPGQADEAGCEVELAEIRTRGQAWWSLGFEAAGPGELLRSELEAAAALVFAQALPGLVKLGADASRSYAAWLRLI
jgi:hypothetical protein